MQLAQLPQGTEATIESIVAAESDADLLRAMGFVEGYPICVLRRAPWGGPLHVRVGPTSFALSAALATSILVRQ